MFIFVSTTISDGLQSDSGLTEESNTESLSDLEVGFSSAAEDAQRLFESEFEDNDLDRRMIHSASGSLALNEYVPSNELIYQEEGYLISSGDANKFEFNTDLQVQFSDEPKLTFSETFRAFTNSRGVVGHTSFAKDTQSNEDVDSLNQSIDDFPHPSLHPKINLWNYYVLDLASILPSLILNVQPNDIVADYCAAPGGKSLCILFQSLGLGKLLLNEPSETRMNRLKNVFKAYIGKNQTLNSLLEYSCEDGRRLIYPDQFDRILMDVPCSNDRLSVQQNQNSLFSNTRMKERITLPETQTDLLCAGLRSLKLGGSLVYSTCSLSPVQNDSVVQNALLRLEKNTSLRFEIRRLKETIRPLRGLIRLHHFNYGEQVIPFLPSNAGPLYICKLVRLQ